MKKIIFVLVATIFCAMNCAMAATENEGKEKNIDNVNITIGDWKINGKVNGKIYISDDSSKDRKGRTNIQERGSAQSREGGSPQGAQYHRVQRHFEWFVSTLQRQVVVGKW